jgi:hypothetical protein
MAARKLSDVDGELILMAHPWAVEWRWRWGGRPRPASVRWC